MPSFTLKSGGYTLRIDTVSLTSVAGYEVDPNPGPNQVDIEGTILNPNMFDYQMPTQETPDPSWSVSPLSILLPGETPYDHQPTDDGSAPPPIDGDFVYDRRPVIDVGAGLYTEDVTVLAMELSAVNPASIVSDVPYTDGSWLTSDSDYNLLAKDCSVSEIGSATYSPASVVSFTSCATFDPALEWYRPAEYGWYLLKLDVPSASEDDSWINDWWWDTEKISGKGFGGSFCRYNPATDPVAGTNDDPLFASPGAVISKGQPLETIHPLAPPSNYLWWWCQFLKGGPADFPAGQRLRCVYKTKLANGKIFNATSANMVQDGQVRLAINPGWDTSPPYPWPADIPWLTAPSGDPGETDGNIEDFNLFKLYFKIRLTKV